MVANFIFEVWILRFGCPLLIVTNRGPENQAFTKKLLKRFNVQNVLVTAYQPQSRGLVEPRYQNIVDTPVKLMAPSGKPGNRPLHLASVLCAYRITVRKSMGMMPYGVLFGQECLLSVAIAMKSWRVVDWLYVERAGNKIVVVLSLRAWQLQRRPENIEKVAEEKREG